LYFQKVLCDGLWLDFGAVQFSFSEGIGRSEAVHGSHSPRNSRLEPPCVSGTTEAKRVERHRAAVRNSGRAKTANPAESLVSRIQYIRSVERYLAALFWQCRPTTTDRQ